MASVAFNVHYKDANRDQTKFIRVSERRKLERRARRRRASSKKFRVLARESRERLERRAPALAHRALDRASSEPSESSKIIIVVVDGVGVRVGVASRTKVPEIVSGRRRRLRDVPRDGVEVKIKPLVRARRSTVRARARVVVARKRSVGRRPVGRAARLAPFGRALRTRLGLGGHLPFSGTGPLRRGRARARERRQRNTEFIRHQAHAARSSARAELRGVVYLCPRP